MTPSEKGYIDTSRARLALNPHTEWQFMLVEAWRLQRDFFWDQHMGAVDWDNILTRYQSVAKRIGTRAELNDLISELHGELGVSHANVMGGDLTHKSHYQQGQLGATTTYNAQHCGYCITEVIAYMNPNNPAPSTFTN